MNCASAVGQRHGGKVMIAGRCSKTVAFVAILALTTFGALATASAQPADIKAIDKAFQDHYARGNYPAAQIEAQKLERLVKARFGADHARLRRCAQQTGHRVFRHRASTAEAEGLFKRALAIREKALGANHSDVGQTLNNLALVYRAQGKYSGGGGALQARVGDPRKGPRCEPPDVGQTLNNLANVYRDQGKYSGGGGALQARAGDPRESARCEPPRRGPDPQQPGPRVSSPGQVQRRRRGSTSARWRSAKKRSVRTTPTWARPSTTWPSCIEPRASTAEAEGLYKRALAIREKALGANHPDVGQTLNNLAIVYRDQGKYSGGGGALQARAGDPRKGARCEPPRRGPDPQQPGHRVSRPGQVQRRRRGSTSARWRSGKGARCEPPRRGPDPQQPGHRVSSPGQVQRRRRGSSSARWRSARRRWARATPTWPRPSTTWPRVSSPGQVQEAEGLYKRALAISEKALGANHPAVAQTLNNLACVYGDQGKYSEAEGLYKRALAIREQALGANHPDVAHTLNNLALVYRAQGKYSEAEGLYKRALAIREQALGANHPDVGQTLNNLALVYRDQGKYSGGGGAPTSARWSIREQALGASHPDVGQTLNNLALVYADAGQVQRGGGAVQARVGDQRAGARCESPRRGPSLANLANVYRDQGKYGEAEGLFKRALAIANKRSAQVTPRWLGASTTWRSSMKLAVKAGARLPIRGRQPLPSLPIELPNRRVLNRRGRQAA